MPVVKEITPKFEIGDKVKMRFTDLYGEKEGTVVERSRMLQAIDPYTGQIDPEGLVTDEDHIKSISLPYRYDGYTLEVDFPEADYGGWIQKAYTMKSVVVGWGYAVETSQMRTRVAEKDIKKIK